MSTRLTTVQACFADQAETGDLVPKFAFIALVAPPGYSGPIYHPETGTYYSTENPIKVELDHNGCFSAELIPNSALDPKDCDGNPNTYYEIAVLSVPVAQAEPAPSCQRLDNGSVAAKCRQKACGACRPKTPKSTAGRFTLSTKFVLDDSNGSLPSVVNLEDVRIDSMSCDPSTLQCNLFKACETPWVGIADGCLVIEPGDHPDGHAGNGHAPTLRLKVSEQEDNALTCNEDGLYVPLTDWDCSNLEGCSIGGLGDVDIEGCAVGNVLQWNGAGFVCGPKAIVTVSDGDCTTGYIDGTGSIANPWNVQFNVDIADIADNQVVCTEGGLYVAPAELAVEAENTKTVTTTVEGTGQPLAPISISSEVNISEVEGNTLECLPDGLYTPDQKLHLTTCFDQDCNNPVDQTSLSLSYTGSGVEDDPLVLCGEVRLCDTDDNLITSSKDGLKVSCQQVVDQIGLASGRGLTYASADKSLSVCLSADSGNILQFDADGCLYAPGLDQMEQFVRLVGCETRTAKTSVTGIGDSANPFNICSDIRVSGNDKNLLTTKEDGVYVGPTSIRIGTQARSEDSCLALELDGCGTPSDPYELDATLRIADIEDNTAVCLPGGLYVPSANGEETKLQVTADSCLSAELSGTGSMETPYLLDLGIQIDDLSGNLLRCTSAGLRVDAPDGSETKFQVADGDCTETTLWGLGTSNSPYILQTDVQVSSEEGNQIKCTQDGLFVNRPTLQAYGADCIELDLAGTCSPTDPWILSANLNISDLESNLLTCLPDGLYAAPPKVTASGFGCVTAEVSGVGTDKNPLHLEVGLNIAPSCSLLECGPEGLQVDNDKLCQTVNDFFATGKVAIPVSTATNNCLSLVDGKAYVPCPDGSETIIQVADGDCINSTLTGSGTRTSPYLIQSDVVISSDPSNLLRHTADGLFASATVIKTDPYGCVGIHAEGLGIPEAPLLLSADLAINPDSCNAVLCTQDGLFVQNRGYLTLDESCAHDQALTLDLSGTGSCDDPYSLSAALNISADPCNLLEVAEDGLLVRENGIFDQSHHNPNAISTSCTETSLLGLGTKESPHYITSSVRIDSQATSNLLRCTEHGLLVEVDPVVQTIINHYTGPGITTGEDGLEVNISEDVNNCLTVGSDFGLFVRCPEPADLISLGAVSTKGITTTVTGTGDDSNPFVVQSDIEISDDPCNQLTCESDGLMVRDRIGFEIGQFGVLDNTDPNPSMWRAWGEGTVEFKMAGLAYGSTANGITRYQIINQSGLVVHEGAIPAGADYEALQLGPFDVSQGQGFAVRVVDDFPDDPACNLVIQGVYTPCNR